MALVLGDRVQVTTSTTGTGTLTLGSAVTGFQDFTVIGDGNTTYYTITNSTAWEVGVGTYTASGTTLARTTILSNSNGNTSPITLSGDSNVFVTYPAVAASDAALPTQSGNAGKFLQTDATNATWEVAGDLLAANNLSDLASAATSRVNLGVETGITGSSILPSGTTAERDGSPLAGYIRWNSTDGSTEVYDGAAWVAVGGGGPSLGTDSIIRTNAQTISENITIPLGTNGMSIGDITIADTYTVTVNGRWIVI